MLRQPNSNAIANAPSLTLTARSEMPVARPSDSVVPSHPRSAHARRGGGSPLRLFLALAPSATRACSGLSVATPDVNRVPVRGMEGKRRESASYFWPLSFSHKTWQADGIADGRRRRNGAVEEKRKKSHQSRMLTAPTLETTAWPSVTGVLFANTPFSATDK